ncbi:hypothetical protein ACWGIV_15885 [Streptomyces sp. NPDC054844]
MVWICGFPSQTEDAHQTGSSVLRPARPGAAGSGSSRGLVLVSRRVFASSPA